MNGSPFVLSTRNSVSRVMTQVMLALIPAFIAHAWFFGPGIWVSLLLCSAFAIGFETLVLLMRNLPIKPFIYDGSALLTAWLLALTLPTLAPWWLYFVGCLIAIVVAKHFYGGLGQNLFNPAMVGFAALIVSFPATMNHWPAPIDLALHPVGLLDAFDIVLSGQGAISPDAYTSATVLDTWKTMSRLGRPPGEILEQSHFGVFGGHGQEWIAAMLLLGGLVLLAMRVITWHIPVAFLASLALTAALLHGYDPAHHADVPFHLASVATMLGAFFIATDPVTAASTPRGKLIYAGLIGLLTMLIRTYGSYPDGVAFAVLMLNMATPFIDAYTQPRVFGHAHGEKVP